MPEVTVVLCTYKRDQNHLAEIDPLSSLPDEIRSRIDRQMHELLFSLKNKMRKNMKI
jgi:hypothetical protein